ncbi:hypothetical protein CfE428DRAFT_1408 [Chthoniobacter flavus Ellin428]|uniref:Uncharacterized protein n=1 Tax=Chthoniobacter flavus Ellin428 TaxID=497964 RepID=B4CXW7_9BACT|nr:hypothetical protein [Chthoniobacter flavus]EDY21115.1 hypothetical protein CfE428DRAFT_1408 [Chthoniobacter flavus Ellin428]TCO83610.1 hypothetical protein EV701_14123 [Chthoniobacter flavus]
MENVPDNQEQVPWYQRCFEELGVLPENLPEPQWLEGEWPEWVARASREVMSAFLPIAELGSELKATPRMLGGILGHQIAAFNALVEPTSNSEKITMGMSILLQPAGGFPATYGDILGDYAEQLADAMKRACAYAIDADYAECSEFFSAFSQGMKQSPSASERTNTRILLALMVGWRVYGRFESVRAVHEAFCKAMGPNLAGNFKRFEKLCQRIGFKLRNRGRPNGSVKKRKFRHRKR